MPLFDDALLKIRDNLIKLGKGERAPMISIGCFTGQQFIQINIARLDLELHALEVNEIVFIGRHLFESRSKDGYTIDDIIAQIESGLDENASVIVSPKMSCLRNIAGRDDGYGNKVFDQAVFEMTSKKPRAELFSVIPRGDIIKPQKQKPAEGGL